MQVCTSCQVFSSSSPIFGLFPIRIRLFLCSKNPDCTIIYKMMLMELGFFLRFYLFIFRERRREGEREGEKHQCVVASWAPPLGTWPTTQACALTGLNQHSFGSQAHAQSTELHQPELTELFYKISLFFRIRTEAKQSIFFLSSPKGIFFIAFMERGKKRGREREKHQCFWPGIKPTTLWLWNDAPTNWATLVKAK